MNTESQNQVEQLDNFPFKTFIEFKKAMAEGVASLRVDRGSAHSWVYSDGLHSTKAISRKTTFFTYLPFLAMLGFLGFVILTGSWLMLLWLPVFLVLFFVFHPSAGLMFGPIRTLLIWSVFIGLAYSIVREVGWLFAVTLTLAAIWYGEKSVYQTAVNGLVRAAAKHEDLLCYIWEKRVATVFLFNGNNYSVDRKEEGGEVTYYED